MRTEAETISGVRVQPCPVLVLGVGNLLLRDEGVGVHVAQAMQRMELPEAVEVVDGATAGLDLLDIIAERRRVIVVDAMDGDYPAGTVIRFAPEDLARGGGSSCSLHGLDLAEVLRLSARLGIAPEETVILGVKPAAVGFGLELSTELSQLLPRVVAAVLDEIDGQEREDRS